MPNTFTLQVNRRDPRPRSQRLRQLGAASRTASSSSSQTSESPHQAISVDDALDAQSLNPVRNAAVATAINGHTAAINQLNEKAPCLPSGSMDATSTSTAFTAQVEGIDELRDGTCVILYNGAVASAEGCTLDINGLGAKPIYNTTSGSTRITTGVAKNYTYLFIYRAALGDNGGWRLGQIFNTNDNTIAYQIRRNYGAYAAAAAIYRYQLCFAYSETSVLPVSKTSNRTAATKTLTDLDFDPFGPILYYNSTTTVALGSNAGVGNMWEARDLDLRYSFNVTTLTNGKNVYVRCSPVISNGLPTGRVTLDADPIAQDLPTTDDGYVYILLGRAFDDYKLYLVLHHPVYCWKGGGIRIWDGGRADALEAQVTALTARVAALAAMLPPDPV